MVELDVSARDTDGERDRGFVHRLSSPMGFFWPMLIFLILVGFVAAILFRQAQTAFNSNPGLNGLILVVLAVGVFIIFSQVLRLRPETRWFNAFMAAGSAEKAGKDPVLLAPMRALIGERRSRKISAAAFRSILDSVASRLDEMREINRYLIGLLVFLGLLGTFWGLLGTVGSISTVIQSLDAGTGDTADLLSTLKEGLSTPLSGMSTAFSSSLFGLSGSLVLGFLDLQAGRAQNRFYNELENWLSSFTDVMNDVPVAAAAAPALDGSTVDELKQAVDNVSRLAQEGSSNQRATAAIVSLAEGIQGLVKNMRSEQQMLRDWIEAHQAESKELNAALEKIANKLGNE
ncbi:MotA/TolQ/ExbB proton channel family protein [Rhizobium sp. L1K21]|uniref:MotA/TolQ/ExbB proton channel family protein n=1 Tax=Rhizobium sp. L1K21 TaxID=2954933 RepID=UPI002091EC23|nr:MotA/TolQ/ExbB proton channel family protein [Rhizobium sp. L1K21]MCO6185062.1 MotA/TolQ/ExbB proton channel family protein [Rhizobium sp. L1K21]